MNIALFGKSIPNDGYVYVQELIDKIQDINGNLWIYEAFYSNIKDHVILPAFTLFREHGETGISGEYQQRTYYPCDRRAC